MMNDYMKWKVVMTKAGDINDIVRTQCFSEEKSALFYQAGIFMGLAIEKKLDKYSVIIEPNVAREEKLPGRVE